METANINLFVFDTKSNFEKSKKNIGSEGSAFKRIICVEDIDDFRIQFNSLNDDELVFMVVHVFYTDKINGIRRFIASTIGKSYPNLGYMYISEGDSKFINKLLIDDDISTTTVYKYHQIQSSLEEEKFTVYTKQIVEQLSLINSSTSSAKDVKEVIEQKYPQCEYAIITALEEDEMERVLPMITKTGIVNNKMHLIEYGYLTSNSSKKIVYASQLSSGMVDAAILATEIVTNFKPKFLIMAGVLGGKPSELNIGDVVIASKVFTIDKGKISELGFRSEIESTNTDNSYITSFKREKRKIINYINDSDRTRNNNINIHFGSIACVRQVIDIENYFETNISSVDRKAIALEMESYGISRACELVNNGETIPIIVKSVMDNTMHKVDNAKAFAAWTSATFVKYILENNLI